MSAMPSMPRPFASATNNGASEAEPALNGALAAPSTKENQSRRSTISIFSTPYTSGSNQEVSTPLLSPTPSASSTQVPMSPKTQGEGAEESPAFADRARSASFLSHSQHYESLKAANRSRSDSATSNASGSAMNQLPPPRSGVAGAFGAVTNLVSNVRHAYSPSLSSQTSTTTNAKGTPGPPIQRFLECEAGDLKVSEVALLLADYKRLAARLNDVTS